MNTEMEGKTGMTVIERINEILHNNFSMEKDSVEKLIIMAYYIGLEKGSKDELDKHNALAREQMERAEKCTYHRMAKKIVGNTFIYSPNYAQDMTNTFGYDTTEVKWK